MKSLNLCLIILHIIIFPGLTLAESSRLTGVNDQTSLINTLDTESEEAEENESKEDSDIESTENTEGSNSETEEKEKKAQELTPEEIARLEKFATADQLYLAGYKAEAAKIYREVKEVWQLEKEQNKQKKEEAVKVFDDPGELSPAGRVFWRNYQRGKEKQQQSQVLSALKLLTTREPQFIPGHIHYAQVLKQYERQEESIAVLNRAVSRYPNQPQLLKAKIDADVAEDKLLDASILARQFALFNPDVPEAEEFNQLAEEYLAQYQSNLRSKIKWNTVGNAIAGTVGFALTGNLFGPLSALQTTSAILKGESSVGESTAKQAKKQLPLVEDPKILEYINEIGQKVAVASGRNEFDYEFYLVMDEQLNAFALPGGKIFINAGAIMNTDSEAELAGLLAHEVSHSALSHGFQLVTQGNLTSNIISYIPYVGSTASSLIVLNYSRGMEKQADIFGTRILVNSGYAADGVRNLMVKLDEFHQQEDNPDPLPWLSSHPNTKQRVQYMEKLIVEQNLNRYAYEGVARHLEIKELVQAKWQEYEKCVEEVNDIEGAKKCAGNEEKKEKSEKSEEHNPEDNPEDK